MKRPFIIMVLAATCGLTFGLTAPDAHAQDQDQARTTIKIGTEGVYPPFNYIEAGQLTGFDVDIARALCERAQLQCEFVTQDWDGMIPALLAHRIDAIVASLSITEERKKQIDFTAKYYGTGAKFVAAKADRITDTSPAALAGKIVGVQGSTTHQNLIQAKYPDVTLKTYATADDACEDLAIGRIDLVLSDKVLLGSWLKMSSAAACCEMVGEDINDPLLGEGVGVGLRKNAPALRDRLDAALAAILADGTWQAINDKYFEFSIY